jgi:hypothetical protein
MSTDRVANGVERAVIENVLDRNREALIETVRGLSDADARRQLVASLTTPIFADQAGRGRRTDLVPTLLGGTR